MKHKLTITKNLLKQGKQENVQMLINHLTCRTNCVHYKTSKSNILPRQ